MEAESIPEAAELAVAFYVAALEAAGLGDPEGTVKISAEVGSLTVAPTRDRELAPA